MPKDNSIRKVLVIGSGPIVIGQAAEFDYAGAQACRVLQAEGINTVLVNSNPATIMTDKHLADEIYLEPLNAETVARIIEKDYDRCRELCELLPEADIIHGNIREQDLLESEDVAGTDALVALTGLDELNMITSLYGTSRNVPQGAASPVPAFR